MKYRDDLPPIGRVEMVNPDGSVIVHMLHRIDGTEAEFAELQVLHYRMVDALAVEGITAAQGLAYAIERLADDQAYERVCARKGLLAL